METRDSVLKTSMKARRTSIFKETGLDDEISVVNKSPKRPQRILRFRSKPDVFEYTSSELSDSEEPIHPPTPSKKRKVSEVRIEQKMAAEKAARAKWEGSSTMYRFGAGALILAILIPLLHGVPWLGAASVPAVGVNGGVIRSNPNPIIETTSEVLVKRDDSPTDICVRWAQQSALVNGTLYIYGGQASTTPDQEANTWNNDFLTLDLTSSWQISSPLLTGLPQPSGPPNVSLGALWQSYTSLYLYGGEFSDDPVVEPPAFAMWEYSIADATWTEFSNPVTSAGVNSAANDQAVQRSAEGAGMSVPALGRGWYFGGHQDGYTTEGWSQSIYRIYLQSLLEYTFPGYPNTEVSALSDGQDAGTDGVWRNITQGGSQSTAGFPERADGLLLYVPGFGADGILLGLAGGTNTTFQQMNEVDVFDIATSTWYKQATSGSTPNIRVNPCAVVAAAPDGSSYNIYMFGGQNLQPAANQTQYNDMWILSVPSFTWIEVDQSDQSIPYPRAGHTCNIWNGQMVVVGGYVGTQLSCDSPGIYVFDMSNLKWLESYDALSGSATSSSSGSSTASKTATADSSSSTFVSDSETNPLNQQVNQLANASSPGGLEGSYGYSVPAAVFSIIGGTSTGGATITAPAQTATAGPLKTGKAVTYTVTSADGATVTETGTSGSGSGSSSNTTTDSSSTTSVSTAAIIAPSVVAGILAIVVCYLIFCTWLYRKRVAMYKRHLDLARQGSGPEEKMPFAGPGFWDSSSSTKPSTEKERRKLAAAAGPLYETSSGNGSGSGDTRGRGSGDGEEDENLMGANEPTFWGTMLAPRRSLRVINRD